MYRWACLGTGFDLLNVYWDVLRLTVLLTASEQFCDQ